MAGQGRRDLPRRFPTSAASWSRPTPKASPGPQDYRPHARRRRQHARRRARAARRRRDVARLRLRGRATEDRAKQAYDEFKPLDGKFRDNVLVQVKNGPIDFQPREPFHPLFGAMPKTPLDAGVADHEGISRLSDAPRLPRPAVRGGARAPTPMRTGTGSTVAQGDRRHARRPRAHRHGGRRQHRHRPQLDAARSSTRRTGTPSAASPGIPTRRRAAIADEWMRMTFRNDPRVRRRRSCAMMMASREAVVDYMTPLGLAPSDGAPATTTGPAPWVDDLDAAPTGTRSTTTAPTRRHRLRPHRRRAATRSRNMRPTWRGASPTARTVRRRLSALVPPRAVGRYRLDYRPHALGRAGRPLHARRRRGPGDAADLGGARAGYVDAQRHDEVAALPRHPGG